MSWGARTPEEHRANGIDVRTRHEAIGLDTQSRTVTVRAPDGEHSLEYDKLVIVTGASPKSPEFARADLDGVFMLRSIPQAERIQEYMQRRYPRRAVLIGGGSTSA